MGLTKPKKRRKFNWKERLFRRYVHSYHARDLLVDLQRHAKAETVEYIIANMRHCMLFEHRYDLLHYAVDQVGTDGLYLEFGVADGASIRETASITSHVIHGFDSFEGLPEDWAGTSNLRGKFGRGGSLPKVPDNVELHVGLFDASIPPFLARHPGPVAFMHVDCDLYSSTKCVFEQIGLRLQAGTIILFDEYFNYPNWKQHEFKAFQEFVADSGISYEYLGYSVRANHVATRVTAVP
jgi:hypothetical protein